VPGAASSATGALATGAAHAASDLTVDHVVPLAAGGAPFDNGNTAVLCRSCNSTKGASTDRGG
jgi:5-methylcytosine-specific restriction endonuclease McrA